MIYPSLFSLWRTHWWSASQSTLTFKSCTDTPAQKDEEQDDKMQAVWKLHCCQRSWMWRGMTYILEKQSLTVLIEMCSTFWHVSLPPSVRPCFAQEVHGGVSVRVWTQEGDCVRSWPGLCFTWQAGWGALCGAAVHFRDWESRPLCPGTIYCHRVSDVEKKSSISLDLKTHSVLFPLRECIEWVGQSLASRSSVMPLRHKRNRWTCLTSHHMTSLQSLNTSLRRY